MRIEVIHPCDLGPTETAAWRALQGDGLRSPYLSPDWARLVGAARPDARIAVLTDGAERGFLGVQRPSRFAAMGLGAPIADYQGLVAAPSFSPPPAALCRALGVGRIDLANVPAGQTYFAPHEAGRDGSWLSAASLGVEGYRAAIKARRPEFLRQQNKKIRKMAKERGEPVFTAQSRNRGHFEQMMAWKNVQLERTGQPQIWKTPWVSNVLNATFDATDDRCAGVFCTLTIGGELIAANYFLRSETVLHDWIMAHDAAFEPYSPGVLLAQMCVEWAACEGFHEVDFGPGGYQYKRQLATHQRDLAWGVLTAPSASGMFRRAAYAARAGIERAPQARLAALPGKAMRKIDLMRGLARPDPKIKLH
ncbi:MAG: GNAT family N-acetyltransferase [Caulobacterales bacterium]